MFDITFIFKTKITKTQIAVRDHESSITKFCAACSMFVIGGCLCFLFSFCFFGFVGVAAAATLALEDSGIGYASRVIRLKSSFFSNSSRIGDSSSSRKSSKFVRFAYASKVNKPLRPSSNRPDVLSVRQSHCVMHHSWQNASRRHVYRVD